MRTSLYFIFLLLNLEINVVLMDFYSSILTMTKLSKEEIRLVSGLKRYIQAEEKEGKNVDKFLTGLLEVAEDDVLQSRSLDNPIDAFHLLKRWVDDWETCFQKVFCSDCEEDGPAVDFNLTREVVYKHLDGWPSQQDVDGTITALFRLWDTYQFNLRDLFHGKLFEFQTKPFHPTDIMYIANKAEEKNDMYTSIKFLETLLEEIQKGNFPESNLDAIRVAKVTASAYNRNDMPWKSVEILQEYVDADPQNKRLKTDYDYFKMRSASFPESDIRTELEKPDRDVLKLDANRNYEVDIVKNYKGLCRGQLKTPKELSKLYCYHRQTEIPYYRVKVELANKQPGVFLFHDIISENEMNNIKNISMQKLTRSTVVLDSTKDMTGAAEIRISKTAWLNDLEYPFLRKISRRVKLITGLETEFKSQFSNAEEYQVLNYGVGGMYQPHLDPLNVPAYQENQNINPDVVKFSGDRIATFMFYLSEVMYGGATVFPKLKARIPVEKGGAAFWYNLDLKGDMDEQTLHAGCPVLVGSKWVSNKWIREIGQAFRRPCGLKPNTKDKQL